MLLCYYRVTSLTYGKEFDEKRFALATRTLDRWIALKPTTADDLYLLARGYGILCDAMTEPAKTDPDRKTQRQKLLDDGVSTLKKALDAGYSDLEYDYFLDLPQFDFDLNSLNEHPSYKALEEQIRSTSEAPQPKRDDVK